MDIDPPTHHPSEPPEQELINFNDWCNHHVIAKQQNVYVSGVICPSETQNSVIVEFKYPERLKQIYPDVFGINRYDIISDASPSAADVTIGTRVCVRSSFDSSYVFIEGVVTEILNNTKSFSVRLLGSSEVSFIKLY